MACTFVAAGGDPPRRADGADLDYLHTAPHYPSEEAAAVAIAHDPFWADDRADVIDPGPIPPDGPRG